MNENINISDESRDRSVDVEASLGVESALEQVGKAIAIVVSIALPISIIFDYGFYQALGVDMRDVPTSLTDHARSAVVWLPLVISAWGAYGLSALFDHRLARGMTRHEFNQSSSNPIKAQRGSERTAFFVRAMGLFFTVLYILFGAFFAQPALVLCVPLWLWFSVWCMNHPNAVRKWSKKTQMAVMFVPVIVLIFYYYGRGEGERALREKPSAAIYYVNVALAPVSPVTILRYMDKGILVKKVDGHVYFYQWSVISSVDNGALRKPFSGVLCGWFNLCGISNYLSKSSV